MRSRLDIRLGSLVPWTFAAAVLAAPHAGADPPADEAASLRKVLLSRGARVNYGLRVPASDKKLIAIGKLEALGTGEAVAALRDFLTTHEGNRKLKIHALEALGRVGTKPAVAAVEAFEAWAERRRAKPPAFRFGKHDYAITHFSPLDLKPAAEVADERGTTWAVFLWLRFGVRRLWLTRRDKAGAWREPVVVPVELPARDAAKGLRLRIEPWQVVLTLAGKEHRFTFKKLWADADADGLTDAAEALLGTKPTSKDSDGDGAPDGADPCPLMRDPGQRTEEREIRQAVMTATFATCGSRDAVILVDDGTPDRAFARQEYRGFAGWFLSAPAVRRGFVNLTGLSVRKAAPDAAEATIRDWEGEEAASVHRVRLRKAHGKWLVVSFRLAMIS